MDLMFANIHCILKLLGPAQADVLVTEVLCHTWESILANTCRILSLRALARVFTQGAPVVLIHTHPKTCIVIRDHTWKGPTAHLGSQYGLLHAEARPCLPHVEFQLTLML